MLILTSLYQAYVTIHGCCYYCIFTTPSTTQCDTLSLHDALPISPMSLPLAIEVAGSGAGIVVVPMSLARLHQRKDVRYVPVTGVAPSSVGLAWRTDNDDTRVETFVGIVRGRTERSSRQPEAAPRRPEQDVRQPGRDRARGADDRRRRRAKGAVKHRGRPRRR